MQRTGLFPFWLYHQLQKEELPLGLWEFEALTQTVGVGEKRRNRGQPQGLSAASDGPSPSGQLARPIS